MSEITTATRTHENALTSSTIIISELNEKRATASHYGRCTLHSMHKMTGCIFFLHRDSVWFWPQKIQQTIRNINHHWNGASIKRLRVLCERWITFDSKIQRYIFFSFVWKRNWESINACAASSHVKCISDFNLCVFFSSLSVSNFLCFFPKLSDSVFFCSFKNFVGRVSWM